MTPTSKRPLDRGNSLRPDGSARWPITTADWPSLGQQPCGYEVAKQERRLARTIAAAREVS